MFRFIDSTHAMWLEPVPRYTSNPIWNCHVVSEPTQTATQDVAALRKSPPIGLVIVHHPDPQFIGNAAHLPPKGPLVLGREGIGFSPEAMVDSRVSRQHAQLHRHSGHLMLTDLDSRNGTTLNGLPIQETPVQLGDVIGLGRLLLLVIPLDPDRLRVPHPRLIGCSAALGRAITLIERVASHALPVLILGETGVGKELLGQEVHAHSGRRGRCITVNCATLPDNLVQSELFGHVKGAFSGAERPRRGLVDEARGGTLVLDEMGEASPSLQANLLRLLQEREVRPVGSDRTQQIDVRFVAATNRNLAEGVRAGRFREDLYARLNRCVVRMPPLRERREDILPLARHFASNMAGQAVSFSPLLALELLRCDWPGNARSLQSIVERTLIEHGTDEPLPVSDWLDTELAHLARTQDTVPTPPPQATPSRATPTRERVEAVLQQHHGHITKSAKALGIGRNTLYRWLKKWDIDIDNTRS